MQSYGHDLRLHKSEILQKSCNSNRGSFFNAAVFVVLQLMFRQIWCSFFLRKHICSAQTFLHQLLPFDSLVIHLFFCFSAFRQLLRLIDCYKFLAFIILVCLILFEIGTKSVYEL